MLPWAEFDSDNLRVFDRGEGARLYDVQGREYLDGIAGLWVVNAGHGRREIAQAYGDQAAKLGYASAMSYTTTPAVELAGKLAELTPGDLNRAFFVSGGSEAVE
ncbi:MAG: aminotransferase class III-fold pyridoxal phosphate-dependent enzyme, partial [Thermomicrobiales bacterium]|nr:aminotransferase class III-fold pyridoxal phosphate-dependent enzyme [Thermomicrobiales bacterium]